MKASKEYINQLRNDYKLFIQRLEPNDLDKLGRLYNENKKHTIWNIYWHVRALNIDKYKEYEKSLKDDHIWTAVRKALNLPTSFKESYE